MDVTNLRKLVDEAITQWAAGTSPDQSPTAEVIDDTKLARTDGKWVARTPSTGDRVMLIDDNAKTKAWATSEEILNKLGFSQADVKSLKDEDLIGYQTGPSIYRVDE